LAALLFTRETLGQPGGVGQSAARSGDWTTRRDAFAQSLGLEPAVYAKQGIDRMSDLVRTAIAVGTIDDARRLSLVDLLGVENAVVAEADARALQNLGRAESGELSEAYVNYYGDLVAGVAALNDQRALPALLGAIKTGSMATDAIASFGQSAVEPALGLLNSDDSSRRYSSALVLAKLVKSTKVDRDGVVRIGAALRTAAADPYPPVRQAAISGLVAVGDAESIAVVQRLSETDPYRAEHVDGQPYAIREAAARALAQFNERP